MNYYVAWHFLHNYEMKIYTNVTNEEFEKLCFAKNTMLYTVIAIYELIKRW